MKNFAERTGFEPVIRFWRIHAFQACLFNHSSTFPKIACKDTTIFLLLKLPHIFFGNNIAVVQNIVLKKLLSEDLTIRNASYGGNAFINFRWVNTYIIAFFSNNRAVTNLFEDLGLSTFFAQKPRRRKKGDLHFSSKCIIFALQKRRCYPDR